MSSGSGPSGLQGYDSFEVKLGDELRGERATKGKSLLDVQRELRIKASYVAAIENCDPSVFPNPGFIAGYVRSYARYLDLDQDQVFARFCAESGFTGVNADLVRHATSPTGETKIYSGPIVAAKDDALFRSVLPAAPAAGGLFADVSISAIGSVAVLLAVVGGLAYGGYAVVKDIQRVELVPVDQTPGAQSDVAEVFGASFATPPNAIAADVPDVDAPTDQDLARLYQPRELDVPVVASRDGPIVDLDPDQVGRYRRALELAEARSLSGLEDIEIDPLPETDVAEGPQVREQVGPPVVNVVAQQPAWVRVYLADGSVLFEKILEAGETWRLPSDVNAPLIRAGNSGAVYLLVDETPYGPIGTGTSVAKNVSMVPDDIRTAFTVLEQVPEVLQASILALDLSQTLEDAAEEQPVAAGP